jgi:hypothetical protein
LPLFANVALAQVEPTLATASVSSPSARTIKCPCINYAGDFSIQSVDFYAYEELTPNSDTWAENPTVHHTTGPSSNSYYEFNATSQLFVPGKRYWVWIKVTAYRYAGTPPNQTFHGVVLTWKYDPQNGQLVTTCQ